LKGEYIMKNLQIYYLFIFMFFALFTIPKLGNAVTLPWSTNFDSCPDYNDSNNGQAWPLAACGLSENGNDNQTCSSGGNTYSQLNANGQNSYDAPGKGFRVSIGDGDNNSSTRPYISLDQTYPELWIRWYMRYQTGFQWSGGNPQYQKLIYFWGSGYTVFAWYGSGASFTGSGSDANPISYGWQNVMGGVGSDGLWHAYEIHIKMDTNGANGIDDFWVDGVWRGGNTTKNFGTLSGFSGIVEFATNQNAPANGTCMFNDWDDIAIQATTPSNTDAQGRPFIGLILGTASSKPSAPLNLH
jgi:hypothetical protein